MKEYQMYHNTVYESLKQNPLYDNDFCEAYKDCYDLSLLEGYVFKGIWTGYSVTPENDDKSYFTSEGIRGSFTGLFTVYKGKLLELKSYNNFICKDKYKEFVNDIYKYIEAKYKSSEILLSLPEVSLETKTQIKDIQSTYETILQLLSKY